MEVNQWYAVIPGTKGAISTPRWQALHQVVHDVDRIITAEYLISRLRGAKKATLTRQLDEAKMLGQQGRFYTMRAKLKELIAKAAQLRKQ